VSPSSRDLLDRRLVTHSSTIITDKHVSTEAGPTPSYHAKNKANKTVSYRKGTLPSFSDIPRVGSGSPWNNKTSKRRITTSVSWIELDTHVMYTLL
jgi:hypothetical protein